LVQEMDRFVILVLSGIIMTKNGLHPILTGNITLQQRIVTQLQQAVEKQLYAVGQQIPSITETMQEYGVSRVTVLQAYRQMQSRGIITSAPGKGFFVATSNIHTRHRVLVLFDELTPYKKVLYDAMQQALGQQGQLDIFFHHFNPRVFESVLREGIGSYTAYVVIPFEYDGLSPMLSFIPEGKLFLLDQGSKKIRKQYPSVCQDFNAGIEQPLRQSLPLLNKYERLYLLYGEPAHEALAYINADRLKGFTAFARTAPLSCKAICNNRPLQLHKGDVYLVLNDEDLVKLVEAVQERRMRVGVDVGIISYNDTPLKRIIAGGLTTISTDFYAMGEKVIDMIITKNHESLINAAKLIQRNSL
jgi:DNA-binding LacI/PurR family transcriptional regulator